MKLQYFRNFGLIIFLCLILMVAADKSDKYSKKANMKESEKYDSDFRNLQKPFRIAKLNMLWSKAVHRLTEPKLKSLFTELKIHDKEELAFKHQKSEKPKDFNDGLKEAELRKKLIGIMSTYDLLEVMDVEDVNNPELYKKHKPYEGKVKTDNYKNKSLFKDKKLNKLWERAEIGGFTPDELQTLKEEFLHHEEKVQMYYSMLEKLTDVKDNRGVEQHQNAINEDELDTFNEVVAPEKTDNDIYQNQKNEDKHQEYISKANQVREKHREIRDNADRLERMTARGSSESEFIEPKVQGLWRVAQAGNFSADELASIKIELHHFESRFLKLRTMHAEHALTMEKFKSVKPGDKHHDRLEELEGKIKKQSRKVEKIQENLEKKLSLHTEL
ncbi:CLUMA_CG005913, isoform A [Clunio marinus]|uniref:CLUMA_CG005913, isoform A n=1 Tax=Clunio marinus TaxID=568069 RepID=A0A1J1I0L8_9DIPT|nr:CLUMA_CG005913, isoform A [Clunio marinus]